MNDCITPLPGAPSPPPASAQSSLDTQAATVKNRKECSHLIHLQYVEPWDLILALQLTCCAMLSSSSVGITRTLMRESSAWISAVLPPMAASFFSSSTTMPKACNQGCSSVAVWQHRDVASQRSSTACCLPSRMQRTSSPCKHSLLVMALFSPMPARIEKQLQQFHFCDGDAK